MSATRVHDLEPDAWPDGAAVAVSLTFDVDGEAGWLCSDPANARRLSTLSDARFGVGRGLRRVLAILERHTVPATFYIPGDTAQRHAEALRAVLAAGHEVGHHGHHHLRSDGLDAEGQRDEIERGLEALATHLGVVPSGYRSPAWELTPETFNLLIEAGFAFDSSCMADDGPYLECHDGQALLELPVHWSLDDWPHLAWHPSAAGSVMPARDVLESWLAAFDCALAEGRHVTYTMHPDVIGRGHLIHVLDELIAEMRRRAVVWFVPHADLAGHLMRSHR
jgi:peptidoglycan-N-acetylglucosamine deacetylase